MSRIGGRTRSELAGKLSGGAARQGGDIAAQVHLVVVTGSGRDTSKRRRSLGQEPPCGLEVNDPGEALW